MVSDYVELLRRRSRAFLREAENHLKYGESDIACFCSEQALQLELKKILYRITGQVCRTHRVHEVLAFTIHQLSSLEVTECLDKIEELKSSTLVIKMS